MYLYCFILFILFIFYGMYTPIFNKFVGTG